MAYTTIEEYNIDISYIDEFIELVSKNEINKNINIIQYMIFILFF